MKMNTGNYLNYRYDAFQRVTDKYIERDVNVDRQIWERFHYDDNRVSMKEVWIGNSYTYGDSEWGYLPKRVDDNQDGIRTKKINADVSYTVCNVIDRMDVGLDFTFFG